LFDRFGQLCTSDNYWVFIYTHSPLNPTVVEVINICFRTYYYTNRPRTSSSNTTKSYGFFPPRTTFHRQNCVRRDFEYNNEHHTISNLSEFPSGKGRETYTIRYVLKNPSLIPRVRTLRQLFLLLSSLRTPIYICYLRVRDNIFINNVSIQHKVENVRIFADVMKYLDKTFFLSLSLCVFFIRRL